jgi:Bifunctional DNA primase/polymerase, N-terminal
MKTFEEATYQARMALAAFDHLEYGFSIVPTHIGAICNGGFICTCGSSACGKSAGKHPAVPWKRYQYFRPTARQIISWAVDFPGYNIGAVHGQASGTVVLDWDGDDGWESRHQLERELGELPATPTIITGSGCEHQVFRHPGRHIPTNKGLRPGFDVRGDGGFSVLPPSRHYLGRTYEWDVDQHIEDLPLADLPAAWVGFIGTSPSSTSNTSSEIVWTPAPTGTPLVRDGRETFIRDCVWRAFCTLERRLGRQPTPNELFEAAGKEYLLSVDLNRAGRGVDELRRKCNALLTRNPRHLPERKGLSKPFLAR